MGTPFEDIYKRAAFKFSDFNFLDFEVELKVEIMHQHLMSAIVDFSRASAIPLTYAIIEEEEPDDADSERGGRRRRRRDGDDDAEKEVPEDKIKQYAFNYDLGFEEQEILALGLVFHWLSGKVLNSELLRNVMHNKDYKSYSPANLLKEMQNLRTNIKAEFTGRINTYTFRNSNLATMRTFRG